MVGNTKCGVTSGIPADNRYTINCTTEIESNEVTIHGLPNTSMNIAEVEIYARLVPEGKIIDYFIAHGKLNLIQPFCCRRTLWLLAYFGWKIKLTSKKKQRNKLM